MNEPRTIPEGTLVRGRYEIQSVLGGGGFGATYLAVDRDAVSRRCVLKELLPIRELDRKARELFEREARTLSQLRHRSIPRLDAFFEDGGRYYLVQEFVSGRTLAAQIKERGAIPESEAVRIAESVLDILCYLHEREPPIIHRDIKPSNLIVSDKGEYFLIDFGAVREAVLSSTSGGVPSTLIASSGYTPPEQMVGRAYPASDIYALGATLLHLLTGKHPLHWYNARQRRWVYEGTVQLSPPFARVLARMLAGSLVERYESAREVLEDLVQGRVAGRGAGPTVIMPQPDSTTSGVQR